MPGSDQIGRILLVAIQILLGELRGTRWGGWSAGASCYGGGRLSSAPLKCVEVLSPSPLECDLI